MLTRRGGSNRHGGGAAESTQTTYLACFSFLLELEAGEEEDAGEVGGEVGLAASEAALA